MITLKTTLGDIKISLNFDKAPITAKNFEQYAKDGFYNGTIFHRVIKGFMAQGGGFASGMSEKDTRASIENEANNGLSNKRGTLAMARTQDPHSASAQFFINLVDNDFLDFKEESVQGWGYCVFGEVVEGMDVIDKMTLVDTGRMGFHDDVPKEEIIIEDTIVE
ncbi:peptidyl-prolyl cis-trans isomerase [Thalassotalea insulae]|uniref:Peptidyl-prolyl cis-trans isomerase n=1 Tax=Thalassotalea insulae TaxID=2056778 RepID=A0ABQ6GPB8_9GAMM|nr:peptidylprolyl isomerase [Thalassotalea insulae]GLX77429.1 peptidyl-prolyl cis-trans isomerase [Thalassotalea insulae]